MDTAFETRLLSLIAGDGALVSAERHLLGSAAAKRVRPKFLLASGALLDVAGKRLYDQACAVELIHTASLLHDDIVDRARKRRLLPSVNAAYGNGLAVLAGDRLLTRALLLLAAGPRSTDAIRLASSELFNMTQSVVLELELRKQGGATETEVLQITDGKTGALFALCGGLAGLAADDDEGTKRLTRAGRLLGRVFQIKDDIDDLSEDKKDGTPTLPLVAGVEAALAEADRAFDEALHELVPYSRHQAYTPFLAVVHKLARMEPPAGLQA